MRSKHFELNSIPKKLYERFVNWSPSKEVYVPIVFLDYDYLTYECFNGRHQVHLAEETVNKYQKGAKEFRHYSVAYNQWISVPNKMTRENILEEMLRIKQGEIRFEDSFFYDYYQETYRAEEQLDSNYERIRRLEEQLKKE